VRITAARLDDGDDELLAAKMHAASLERRRPSLVGLILAERSNRDRSKFGTSVHRHLQVGARRSRELCEIQ